MHPLLSCKARPNAGDTGGQACPLCRRAPETVEHFLLRCEENVNIRPGFENKISDVVPGYTMGGDSYNLRVLLNIEFPNLNQGDAGNEAVNLIASYVLTLYKARRMQNHQ